MARILFAAQIGSWLIFGLRQRDDCRRLARFFLHSLFSVAGLFIASAAVVTGILICALLGPDARCFFPGGVEIEQARLVWPVVVISIVSLGLGGLAAFAPQPEPAPDARLV